ncbi:MAG: D-alanyl-D-alanine carboxypeptidase [Actinomycetia bacterium]|nr:D-alanyl-D-alanine carboxypeptidase [Actinomycetes bacterium]
MVRGSSRVHASHALRALIGLGALALATLIPIGALAGPAVAAPTPTTTAEPVPASYILVDADSGTVLLAKSERDVRYPASTIKLLTALSALQHVSMNDTLPISDLTSSRPAMKIGMHTGEQWKASDVFESLMLVSANDAAYALAEKAGGTVTNFAVETNAYAKALGMRDTTFKDPAGLDDSSATLGGSTTSAYDLAIAARNVLAVPALAEMAKQQTFKFTGPDGVHHTLTSHDTFLKQYNGANGLKTGFTSKAGRGFVASATRNGRTMIAVVLGVYDYNSWAARLLDQGFATPTGAAGINEKLPPVVASTLDARNALLTSLPRALGGPKLQTAAATAGSATTAPTSTTAASSTTAAGTTTAGSGTAPRTTASSGSSGGGLPLGTIAIVLLVLLTIAFFARRAQVKRRRKVRLARQRALAVARRRNMIDIVEPPTAETSHVAVIRPAAGRKRDRSRPR